MTAYRNNPVVLFAHDSSSPPIGRTTRVWRDGTRLLGDAEFAPAETYAFADTIYRLVTGGFLKNGSVGFLPVNYKFSDRPAGGIDYRRQELFGIQHRSCARQQQCPGAGAGQGIVSRRDIRRLRRGADDDLTPVVGNCGRPKDSECGMLDPNQCAIHRQEGGWDGLTVIPGMMNRGTAGKPPPRGP
jgi:hypothetical protein